MIVYYRGDGSWYDLIKRKKNDFIKVQLTEPFHVNGLFSIDVNAISDITYDKKTSVSLLLPCELEIDKRIAFSNAKNLLTEIPKNYTPKNPYFKLTSQFTVTDESISNVLDALKNISIRKKLNKQEISNKIINSFISENNFSSLNTLKYNELKPQNPRSFGGDCLSIIKNNNISRKPQNPPFSTC